MSFTELTTSRLCLRRITMADLVDYNRFTSDPEVTKFMMFRSHQDLVESAASIDKLQQRYATGV